MNATTNREKRATAVVKRSNPSSNGKVIAGYDSLGRPRWIRPVSPKDKLDAHVVVAPNGCHIWTGAKNSAGYGVITANTTRTYAHRLSWELTNGEIPAGLQLDHRCHTDDSTCLGGRGCKHRACVNPANLEIVTAAENSRRAAPTRRSHCPKGHAYSEDNMRPRGGKARDCRTCHRERQQTRRAQRTHCPKGHALTPDNIRVRSDGITWCLTCRQDFAEGQRGERNRSSRLTDGQRVEIRTRIAGGESRASLARAFGVSASTISNVINAAANGA